MTDTIGRFRDAMTDRGVTPPDIIDADGQLHRYSPDGHPADLAGWYVLHDDGIPAGAYGSWRAGISETWCARSPSDMTSAERDTHRERMETIRRERDAERENKHADARTRAAEVWDRAKPETGDHKYLRDRKVQAYGGIRSDGERLVIPMRDTEVTLHSIQHIDPRGGKRYLTGGRVSGCYFAIGKPNGTLGICEGYATGASIYAATDQAVAVAFNAGNLKPVAEALQAKYPDLRLVICADDDINTDNNPGLTAATAAARAVNGLLAVPDFDDTRPDGATDFNDLARHRGSDVVRACIDNAKAPARDDVQSRSENTPTGNGEGRITYRKASDIQAKPIRWLWLGRIARGKVSMLAGNPGLGKSQVTASLAAIVSTGGTWPVDRTHCEQGNVMILSAEDDPADTIRPRLEAAGADLSRVMILDGIVRHTDGSGRALSLKSDMERLGATLAEIDEVALVVIDPITAYLGDADSHKNAEIRGLLTPLSDLAAKHATAVVCVSHLNKSGGSDALMRVTGSLAFVAAARAAFLVAKDKENEARRLFLPMKNNIGNDRTGLAFSVQSAQVDSAAGVIDTSRIMWEAESVTVTADEAMREHAEGGGQTATDDAKEFLREILKDGPVESKRIRAAAEEAGYSWRTIRRAKDDLKIQPSKTRFDGGWEWSLPTKVSKNTEDVQQNNVDTFGKVGHLRSIRAWTKPTFEVVPDDDAEVFEVDA